MAYFWEGDFWKGKKGETDFWDIATLGGNEIASQTFGSSNPLNAYGHAWSTLTKDAGRKLKNLGKDVTGVTAADKAAEAQRTALADGQSSLERMFDKSMETQKPWLEAGGRALSTMESGMNSGRFNVDPGEFSYEDYQDQQFDFEADPGYQWRMDQGMKALEGSAAARGGLFSTNTGDRIQDYAQGLASQEYGAAYDRYNQDRIFGRGNYENDRNFDYGQYFDDRNFGRSNFESDRNYGRDIYDLDRNFAYNSALGSYDMNRQSRMDDYNRLAALSGTGQLTAGNMASEQMTQGGNLASIAQQRGNIGAERAMAGYQGGMNLVNTGLQSLALYGAKK